MTSITAENLPLSAAPVSPSKPFIAFKETRSLLQRIWHVVHAIFQFIGYYLYKAVSVFFKITFNAHPAFIRPEEKDNQEFEYRKELLPWNKNEETSKGLFLFVHGYNASPEKWTSYLDEYQIKKPGCHYLAPHVPLKGDCSAETAAKPLLELVQDYTDKYPANPLYLFGFSNGARLITYIEGHLVRSGGASLKVVSIAGPHHGTPMVDIAKKIVKLTPVIHQELRFKSPTSQSLLQTARRASLCPKPIRHFFYASTEDEIIPIESAMPERDGAIYRFVHGWPHRQIPYVVQEMIYQDLFPSTAV